MGHLRIEVPYMADSRKPIPPGLEKHGLRLFYGGKRDVLTGSPSGVHWHHLDDDATRPAEFGNLVPISSDLNHALNAARNAATRREHPVLFDARVDPEYLLRAAGVAAGQWDYARAYGCARLAHYVGRLYAGASPDLLLRASSDAFFFARHRLSYELLEDIAVRDFEWVLAGHAGHPTDRARAQVLRDIAALYSERGRPDKGAIILERLHERFPGAARDLPDPHLAAALRRDAMLFAARSPGDSRMLPELQARLRESVAIASQDSQSPQPNAHVGALNSTAWFTLLQGRRLEDTDEEIISHAAAAARRLVDPRGGPLRAVQLSPWNTGEVLLNAATVMVARGVRRDAAVARGYVDLAAEVFGQAGTSPYELRPGFCPGLSSLASLSDAWPRSFGPRPLPPALECRLDGMVTALLR